MSRTLRDVAVPSSFLRLTPDPRLNTPEAARANHDNLTHTPRIVPDGHYSYALPEQRKQYVYLMLNPRAMADLGLDPAQVSQVEFQLVVLGEAWLDQQQEHASQLPPPWAQAYAGYQFGQFAGQLGDGRVVNLFDIPKPQPLALEALKQRPVYELQLKGAGKTPYLRFADGKAVLRSLIREYIISEHLNALGIPTTRALLLTYLPQTYAQRYRAEKCAIVARFAELWVRLGSFDLCRSRGDRKGCRLLANYVIDDLFQNEFSEYEKLKPIAGLKAAPSTLSKYDEMYLEVVARNAYTAARWQVYGFLNGVLNTDNTLIVGLLMDFGPFLIMDKFNPNYTPNLEDHDLRYLYKNLPTAIWWNLTRLGEDLAELLGAGPENCDNPDWLAKDHEDEVVSRATKVIEAGGELYQYAFTKSYVEGFFDRLGLSHKLIDYSDIDHFHQVLVAPLLQLLFRLQCDYNKFFLQLAKHYPVDDPATVAKALIDDIDDHLDSAEEVELTLLATEWLAAYRSYIVKQQEIDPEFVNRQAQANPLFLPRGWILDEVIEKTEESQGTDLRYLEKLQKMSLNPYDASQWGDELKDVEQLWMVQGDKDGQAMLQCLCSL